MTQNIKKLSEHNKLLLSAVILFAAYAVMFFTAFFSYGGASGGEALAYAAIVLLLCISTVYYVLFLKKQLSLRKTSALAAAKCLSFLLIIAFSKFFKLPFLAPYAFCALLISVLLSPDIGFFSNLMMILAFFAAQVLFHTDIAYHLYFPLFAGILGGAIAAYLAAKAAWRIKYIIAGAGMGAFSLVTALAVFFAFGSHWGSETVVELVTAFSSGIVSVMLIFLIVPLFERIFNITTNFRLAELTNTTNPLLKRLFEEAPGTFNHCLTVANYAEACAAAIGASTFLARAAAYYHDIGKLKAPNLFVENQSTGANPHDDLTPEASVMAIKKHITYGLALARKYHLPFEIQEVIMEHHGTMPIKYFYMKAKKYTDGDLPYDDYRYEGPLPSGKISGIIMIADACEAALRANPKEEPSKIVKSIIDERMEFNQFADCDLTMREIDIIRATILSTYMGIKHDRIKYPKTKLINTEKDSKGNN